MKEIKAKAQGVTRLSVLLSFLGLPQAMVLTKNYSNDSAKKPKK